MLTGPPGTGKTTLAQLICAYAEARGITPGNVLTTATTDWTTFDTIGGYVPTPRQTLQFRPGIFLEAIRQGQWLVIDEMNRAEIDKAVGELFTVLAGQQVDLPYTVEEQPVRIFAGTAVAKPRGRQDYDFLVHPAWRIIGTMNVYDKASLFQMSFAFMRRFAFIDVGLPPAQTYADLCKQWWRQELAAVHQVAGDETSPFNRMVEQLAALLASQILMRHRALGPAIIRDIVRYVGNRARTSNDGFPENAFIEALMLFVTPQLDGLDSLHIRQIHAELGTLCKAGAGAPELRTRLLERIELLYPHIDGSLWQREQSDGT
ncbi:MAG: AAA family ATPase [Chloroflexota bacterium]